MVVSASGPAAGFLLAGVVAALIHAFGGQVWFVRDFPQFWTMELSEPPNEANLYWYILASDLLWVNIFWGLVNLLPVHPLDGGHIAREVSWPKIHRAGICDRCGSPSRLASRWCCWRDEVGRLVHRHSVWDAGLLQLHHDPAVLWTGRLWRWETLVTESHPQRSPGVPVRRVVLLGASNLRRSAAAVVDAARQAWGAPLDILAAMGHGRSFGLESRFLGRTLPSILACGLWRDLANRPPCPTAALVTDIGNDIVYGASVEQIAGWVRTCLDRLAPTCHRIAVTQLPLESMAGVGRARFLLLRTVLFPGSRLTVDEVMTRAGELNHCVITLAARYDATVIRPEPQWYGFDPIHILRRHRKAAWKKNFSRWRDGDHASLPAPSPAQSWMLFWLRPLQRRWFGWEQQQTQPAGVLPDGSLISLY